MPLLTSGAAMGDFLSHSITIANLSLGPKKKKKGGGRVFKGHLPAPLYLSAVVFCLKTEVFVVSVSLFTHTRFANNRNVKSVSFFYAGRNGIS